ncbi:hypothetical protein Dalk_1523 [Desulfatibacillum aliphaticivorans]|uniref:Uncharacterized protein n=1 Tax=Desulfatibacillum aliphaticivorans TaxID=218208 RepID=B8FAC5_DESAL|nr:hypothetical protein Dalk_1523 [Desulfatibacillum aliphaticivorans]
MGPRAAWGGGGGLGIGGEGRAGSIASEFKNYFI